METIEPRERLASLAAFAAVVETESFSAAARHMGVSKGTVSKRIAALEDRLGVRLLNRTTRRMSLTEVGGAFHARCVRILAEMDEAERAAADLHAAPRGTLRLSAPLSFGVVHLARAIPDFMALYPDLHIDLVLNDRTIDLIDEGFDLAVHVATLMDSTLIARKIAPSRRVVVASPDYWARHGKPERPADLVRHSCLIYAYLASPADWLFHGPDGAISVRVKGPYRANNGDMLRAAALVGRGVYLAPTFIVGDDIAAGGLETALDAYEPPEQGIYAVYPQNSHLSAKVRLFVDFLAERFGCAPRWDRSLAARGLRSRT